MLWPHSNNIQKPCSYKQLHTVDISRYFFRVAAGAGEPHTLSALMHLEKYSENYLAVDPTSKQGDRHKRKSLQVLAKAVTHVTAKKISTCTAKPQKSRAHQTLMYIVQGDQTLMGKDERDTYWLPYTWYHK